MNNPTLGIDARKTRPLKNSVEITLNGLRWDQTIPRNLFLKKKLYQEINLSVNTLLRLNHP